MGSFLIGTRYPSTRTRQSYTIFSVISLENIIAICGLHEGQHGNKLVIAARSGKRGPRVAARLPVSCESPARLDHLHSLDGTLSLLVSPAERCNPTVTSRISLRRPIGGLAAYRTRTVRVRARSTEWAGSGRQPQLLCSTSLAVEHLHCNSNDAFSRAWLSSAMRGSHPGLLHLV